MCPGSYRMRIRVLIWSATAASWLVLVGSGFHVLYLFASTPGAKSPAPEIWPKEAHLDRKPGSPILVLFLHPNCPCSRATLAELEKLQARTNGRLSVRILFFRPEGAGANWDERHLWETARAIPGVIAMSDP